MSENPPLTVIEVDDGFCDACPAIAHVRAYVYAEMPSGLTLAFCGHHGTQHRAALTAQGATIIDLTYTVQP